MDSKLFICGGCNQAEIILNSLYSVDTEDNYVSLNKMSERRTDASLCGVGSLLLVIGGYTKEILSSCEKYSLVRNKWDLIPSLKTARRMAGSCALPSH